MSKKESTVAEATKSTTILDNYDRNVVKGISSCITIKESVLLIGETGTGKTTLCDFLAKERGKTLHRVSVNGSMGVDEILGKWLAKDGSTYWIDGILTSAVRNGDWVIFDELNAMLPEMGFALHSLLDDARSLTLAEKDGEKISAHEDFRFFGSMNPSEEYAGTKEVNRALMSRFGGVFIVDVFPPDQEQKVLERHGVKPEVATKLVSLANQLRDMKKKGDLATFCSTRDIIQAGKLVKAGESVGNAVEFAVINKFTDEEREDLLKIGSIKKLLEREYKTAEQVKHEAEVKALKADVKTYSDAYTKLQKDYAELRKEIAELKKGDSGVVPIEGIDANTARMLKALGVDIKKK